MRRALEEAKKGFGEGDGHVAAAYNNLAEVYRNSREFDKAEPLYLEVRSVVYELQKLWRRLASSRYSPLSLIFLQNTSDAHLEAAL